MKKLLLSIIALFGIVSAHALTVTFNGQNIENGTTITFGKNSFEITDLGFMKIYDGICNIGVSGYTPSYSLSVKAPSNQVQVCEEGGNCMQFDGADGNYFKNLDGLTHDFHFQMNGSGNEIPSVEIPVTVVISAGAEKVEFTVVYNTNVNETTVTAGVNDIIADGKPVNVYTTGGVKVLEDANPNELGNLAPGLYILNGKKVLVR